ncbi:MAG: hypothetical protein Q4D51_07805 [Eubacteriales bacterium]|nr:hypothetical protein [Eubacteriales bacterium]
MLGKLVKDEIKSYRMPSLVVFLMALFLTVFFEVVNFIPVQKDFEQPLQILSFYAYYYILILLVTAVGVFAIVRFYRTTVGDRGYLTWTLPVKTSTIIWSKLLGAMFWKTIAFFVAIILFGIYIIGKYKLFSQIQVFGAIMKSDDFHAILKDVLTLDNVTTFLTVLVCIFITQVGSQLLIYFCIAIGQLFGKWRVLASVGCYFLTNLILQIVSVICMVAVFTGVGNDMVESVMVAPRLGTFITKMFANMAGVNILLTVIFFYFTNMIFKKHLNLE